MIRRLLGLLLLLSAVGCASAPPPPAIATAPSETWGPKGRPSAIVIALHGFNDLKSAFAGFGPYAARQGVRVIAYDQPGFGEQPDRGSWPGTAALDEALAVQIRRARIEAPGVPLFVLGESMGAAVAVTALTPANAPQVDGVILAAPAVWGGTTLSPLYRVLLRIIGTIAPGLQLTGQGLGVQASDNAAMLMTLGLDPLFIKATRVEAIDGLVRLMDEARSRAPDLETPTFVLIGEQDQIIPPAAQWTFVRKIGASRCTVAAYPNGWHLLLRDHDRQLVWDDILAWVGRRAPPSGLADPCRPPSPTPVAAYDPLRFRSAASG